MILVYCDHITPRHRFIFDFIFGDILAGSCRLTVDREEFNAYDGPKFSYASRGIPGSLNFQPHPLLGEIGIKAQQIKIFKWNDLPVFFGVNDPSDLPFDPFALSFYLVTRYEEYLPFEADEHGRFTPELSLAFREGFLQLPLVDVIARELKKILQKDYPGIDLPGRKFRFIPTFDIDIAFAHLGKGAPRAIAAWIKLFLKADFKQVKERFSTLTGKKPDPYDNFHLHLELSEKYKLPVKYFVLLGNFSRYDRNSSYKSRRFRDLILKISHSADVGIHPSYRSYLDPGKVMEEKHRLEMILKKPVEASRFHFLRLKFPDSFRILSDYGIKDDYSLGYSSLNGFRASTCTPFYFYDLIKEEKTRLRLHPFIFMDSAMVDHRNITPGEAISEILNLTGQVSKLGGEAIGIWHNYALSETDHYKGWQEVLISIFKHYQKL